MLNYSGKYTKIKPTFYLQTWWYTWEIIIIWFDCIVLAFSVASCNIINTNDTAYDKTYNKTCATSENSDRPVHPRNLIRVFADRMCLLQLPGHPKLMSENPSHTGCMNRLIGVSVGHRSYCRFCRAPGQICNQLRTCAFITVCWLYHLPFRPSSNRYRQLLRH